MENKKSKWSIFLNTIIDILFIPILLLALVASVLMFSAKKQNEVPSLFGYSSVVVLTNSMKPDFEPGDYAMVKAVNTDTLEVGDIIAFYAYYKEQINADDILRSGEVSATPKENATNIPTTFLSFFGGGMTTLDKQEAIEKGSKVLFHRIIFIHVDNKGDRFFVTKGDNNLTADTYAIHESMVVGKYEPDKQGLASVFRFAGSSKGIVLLVILPSGIMLLLLSQSIIDQIVKLKQEKLKNQKKMEEAQQAYKQLGEEDAKTGLSGATLTSDKQTVDAQKSAKPKVEPVAQKVVRPVENLQAKQNAVNTQKPQTQANKIEKPVAEQKPTATVVTPVAPKVEPKVAPKVAPTPKVAPKPATPVAPKVAPKPVATPKAPAKPPVAPKVAPAKPPVAPKPTAPAKPPVPPKK